MTSLVIVLMFCRVLFKNFDTDVLPPPWHMRSEHLDRQLILASRLGAFLTPTPALQN